MHPCAEMVPEIRDVPFNTIYGRLFLCIPCPQTVILVSAARILSIAPRSYLLLAVAFCYGSLSCSR